MTYHGGNADAFLAKQWFLIRPTLTRATTIVVPSEFLRAVFAKYGVSTTIVPNVVNVNAFHPAETLPAAPHLIVTRNLEPIYDIGTIIRAFAIVSTRFAEATLTIAGTGPDREMLERLAVDLDVAGRIRFTGQLDNRELPLLYRTASVAVNGSRVDNMPISLLEAMASGVPNVSTNVGGIPHLVEDGRTALLVCAGDPDAMARAIMRVLEDGDLARHLREAGLEAVRKYSWANVRAELLGIYREAAERVPRRATFP